MQTLLDFSARQPVIARAAEAIRLYAEPIRKNNDGWVKYPDGRSRPGMTVSREALRTRVRQAMGPIFSEEAYQEALILCTVNSRSRTRYYPVWNALQELVAGEPKLAERAHYVRHYYDLLLRWTNDSLQTAPTDDDPVFRMYQDPQTLGVRLGRLIDWQQRVDHHFYLLEVYGEEPEYIKLSDGEYLYFDGPEIVD